MRRAKIIALANQKGGVGKTTTAVNFSASLAATGKKTLLVDADPQGNASTAAGYEQSGRGVNLYDVMCGKSHIRSAIKQTDIPGFHLIASVVELAAIEVELASMNYKNKEMILKNALAEIIGDYDYIIIDCPPSLGLLTVNSLSASHTVIIPMQCEFYSLEGLSHLLDTIELIQLNLNPSLSIEGILLTMYDARNRLTNEVEKDVREHLEDMVYKTVIPRNIRLSEAPSYGRPAVIFDRSCKGSKAYINFVKEFLKRRRVKEEARSRLSS